MGSHWCIKANSWSPPLWAGRINPFLGSHCLTESLSLEWDWAHPSQWIFTPPRHVPLCPSAPGCCWEPSHHLWLQKQQLQFNNVETLSDAHLGSHLASHHTHPCQAKQRVFHLLPPVAEGWTKTGARLMWNRRQIITEQEAEGACSAIHPCKQKGICLPEATIVSLHSLRAHFEQCSVSSQSLFLSVFPCFSLPSSFLFVSISLLQANATSQIFNCSNLMQFPGCPYSKVDLTQPCIFKGPFNSNYRPDEWGFIFQSSQVSSIQKCQILPSCPIQLRVLLFCANAGNISGKRWENTFPEIRTISWTHVCTV